MNARIYVEGGGDFGNTKSACRQAFHEFFSKFLPVSRQPRVIASGGRDKAFRNFNQALHDYAEHVIVLIVDSEGPVGVGTAAWTHLNSRDGWVRPGGVTDDQAQLMVQCMESWFLADRELLDSYYGQNFHAGSLPGGLVENVAKNNVIDSLGHATRHTSKGKYLKSIHGFALLAQVDPAKVRAASPRAEQLCTFLINTTADI